jgi:hypothetical protein
MSVSNCTEPEEGQLRSDGEIMEILAAYDLTGSQRTAAELVGCSHDTVAAHVAARDAGRPVGTPARRPQVTDANRLSPSVHLNVEWSGNGTAGTSAWRSEHGLQRLRGDSCSR